jgi:hypothetical protein
MAEAFRWRDPEGAAEFCRFYTSDHELGSFVSEIIRWVTLTTFELGTALRLIEECTPSAARRAPRSAALHFGHGLRPIQTVTIPYFREQALFSSVF